MDQKTESDTSIPCSRETFQRLKARKRGGETWNSLLLKMEAQFDPETHINDSRQ